MQLTKGAIGNLINRYKAVLKKCHLLNVFGSLAVAGMLVMGGAAAAGAADTVKITYSGSTITAYNGQTTTLSDDGSGKNIFLGGTINNIQSLEPHKHFDSFTSPTSITVTDGSYTWDIYGGSLALADGTTAGFENTTATSGSTTLTINDGTFNGAELVGGGSASAHGTGIATATVNGDTKVTINSYTHDGNGLDYIMAGNKVLTSGQGKAQGTITGNTNLTIDPSAEDQGVTTTAVVLGGSGVRVSSGNSASASDTINGNTNVTIEDGTLAGVVGGSIAEVLNGTGSATATVKGDSTVTINGGTINQITFGSDTASAAVTVAPSVVGGSLAYGDGASVINEGNTKVTINDGTFTPDDDVKYTKIVAGSIVAGGAASASISGNSQLVMTAGTVNDDLIGGGMVQNATGKDDNASNLTIGGDSSVTVKDGMATGEIIGGNYVKVSGSASVNNSSVHISGGEFAAVDASENKAQYIIGGSKTNASDKSPQTGNTSSTVVTGNSSVTIEGNVTIADGAVVGGSQAKATGSSMATATVQGDSSVTINNSNLAGVVGGGIAETYSSTAATATSTVEGTSSVTIQGGAVTGMIMAGAVSSNTGYLSAAVVGGGLANDTGSKATVGSTRVLIAGGEIDGKVVAGGAAAHDGESTVTGNTFLSMTGGTVSGDLIGGGFVEAEDGTAEVKGSTHITVSGGSLVDAEIIGGGSVRNASGTADVGNTNVTVTKYANNQDSQDWVQYVIGGGKAMVAENNQTATANVTGSTNVIVGEQNAAAENINIAFGTVTGGGLARTQATESTAMANVDTANVTVWSGQLSGVVGGGIAEVYTGGTATATVDKTNLTINGGTINGAKYGDVTSEVAVIGGGIAWTKAASATPGADVTTTATTTINGGTINGHVIAGGMADGTSATAGVTNANLTINDGTINGSVYAGGAALGDGEATVDNFAVRIMGGTITGNVVAGNYTEAVDTTTLSLGSTRDSSSTGSILVSGGDITGSVMVNEDVTANVIIDGTGATVTNGYTGNANSTLTFQNYNDKFNNVATGFGTLAVAENSTVTMDALVSGQQGEDNPKGFFGSPTPEDGQSETSHPLTITGGGTITAGEFHVDPDASVTIESGNVVADEAHVKSAQLTVGNGTASASFTVNNALTFENVDEKPAPSIHVENLGTATLDQKVVLDDEGKIDTTIFTASNLQVNTGGTLKLERLDGKTLTADDLNTLKNTTNGGLLDVGAAELSVIKNEDGTVKYNDVAGITSDTLQGTTVAVDDSQNTDGISGGFQAVKLTENDTELNATDTLVLAGSQNGGNLVMQDDGSIANLRVGGDSASSQATSVVTLGLADANNTGAVNTVTMNAGSGKNATLNVIGAGTAEFTTGDIRANSSTNTINVQGATLNTGNITTEEKTAALDAMNITNGTVKAAGDAKIENVTLDNGLLQAVATTGDTPAGGNITIAEALSGQGAVVADKTLTLTNGYTGTEGDDLTLQATTLDTEGAIDSTTGDLAIAATNLVTSGETTLVDDTLVAEKVALGDALTAFGASLVQVGGFYTSGDFTTEGLNKAVSVTDQSLMAYGADLAQAQQAVAETGHTGAAYYAGKTLTLDTNGSLTVGTVTPATTATTGVAFGNGSLLVVDGTAMNGQSVFTGPASGGATATVADGAKLHVDNAIAGNFTVFGSGFDTTSVDGWTAENVTTDSAMLNASYDNDGSKVTVGVNDAHTVFPNLSHELATAVNTLYDGKLNSVDSADMGVRFLSRATNDHYLGADKQAAASTIESAARMAFAGAVPQMTRMASDAGTNAVVNRLGFANPADGAQAMNAEGKIVDRNTTGFALWIAPLWQNQHGWGMEAGNLDYGFNGNLGGVSLGADYTFENAIRAGITFNIGGGYAESSGGDLNSTENRMTFWGLGAYAGWNYENFGLMADVSYTSTWNDLEQDMDGRMGMGDLEADVQATAISAGLRAEYKLETSVLDIIPHIGVRYMSLNTWGYDVDTNGGTVLEGDGFHQDIWTFPIGVTFSKDFTLDSGWFFKPSVDFSVIPAAGDIKAKQDVAFTGLPGTYEVETQMMDYLTWQGGVGIQMGNDNLSFGVNYTLQAGQNTTGHGVFGSFRYEF